MALVRGLQRVAEADGPVSVNLGVGVREYDAMALEAIWDGLDKVESEYWFQEEAQGREYSAVSGLLALGAGSEGDTP